MKEKAKKEKGLIREIDIPEGVNVEIKDNEVHIKFQDKEIKRRFSRVLLEKKDNKIIIKTLKSTKREKKQANTIDAHIENMLKGIKEDFLYKLQICSVHFPMTVSIQGDRFAVKNFLGEIKERKTKILPGVEVKVDKDIIEVKSINKEAAGQTAANIEKLTSVRDKDRRIFQDGIFMIEKAGKGI